jgi:hypothetical protein
MPKTKNGISASKYRGYSVLEINDYFQVSYNFVGLHSELEDFAIV